ncbi:Nitrogen assimilation transcription factor nit-4 [Vanrija pseudolonga]|uniref:Nitrogen assimilation transcription factor nit-4 n=1 Tax=Vanrija pseudolonga TaxID=143232 RepID=A0AAF0YHM5_9TREE|nr:Nitrogen assimilation transcription factor nit-4 [Vanrija pseudolonga]
MSPTPTMKRSPTPISPGGSSARKRQHVSKACFNCRDRKKKCDGVTPVCGTCKTYKDDCIWTDKADFRKSVSRSEANALRARVAELEAALRAKEGREAMPAPASTSPVARFGHNGARETADSGPTMLAALQTTHAYQVQDDHGRLRFHGPTSAFRHSHQHASEPLDSTSPSTYSTPRRPNLAAHHVGDAAETEFRRWLPDYFISKEQHDLALDRFFRYFACWAQRVTPHLFYRDMAIAQSHDQADLPVATPNYSPLLHNMMLSLGLAYMDEEHLRSPATRRTFAKEGMKHMERECATPSVATVQALCLWSSHSSTLGDHSLGWVNFGLAVRLSYALGLNVDTSPLVAKGRLSQEALTQRNVTFWSCFCQEETWAIYIGGVPFIGDYTVPLPTPDKITDDLPWVWPPGPFQHLPPQPGYLSLAFVHTSRLMQIAAEITKAVYSGRSDKTALVREGTVQRWAETLDGWLDGLPRPLLVAPASPDPVVPHILMIHLAWAWIVILLFRPFSQVVSKSPGNSHAVDISTAAMTRCHKAALKIVQLATLWEAQHGLRYTAITAPQFLYTAGTTFLLAAAQAALPSQAAAALQKARTCLVYLGEIGRTWVAANQKAAILQDLLNEYAEATPHLTPFLENIAAAGGHDEPTFDFGPNAAANDAPNNAFCYPTSSTDTMTWAGESNFDHFIQSLMSQFAMPLGAEADLLSLLQVPDESA